MIKDFLKRLQRLKISLISVILGIFISASLAGLLFAEEEFVYDSKGRRDPFAPLITQSARVSTGLENVQTVEDIILEGIVWDAHGDSIAILNGVIVSEGQQVGNVKILDINEREITFLIYDVEYRIATKGEESGEE